MKFSYIANKVPSKTKTNVCIHIQSPILTYWFILLRHTEGYSKALIYLLHLIGFDPPLYSIILLIYTSNVFLEKSTDTEKG